MSVQAYAFAPLLESDNYDKVLDAMNDYVRTQGIKRLTGGDGYTIYIGPYDGKVELCIINGMEMELYLVYRRDCYIIMGKTKSDICLTVTKMLTESGEEHPIVRKADTEKISELCAKHKLLFQKLGVLP